MRVTQVSSFLFVIPFSQALPLTSPAVLQGKPLDPDSLEGINISRAGSQSGSQINVYLPSLRSLKHRRRSQPHRSQAVKEKQARETGAIIGGVVFPRLDGSSKEATYLDVEFQPEVAERSHGRFTSRRDTPPNNSGRQYNFLKKKKEAGSPSPAEPLSPRASSGVRSYSPGRFALDLDGYSAGYVRNAGNFPDTQGTRRAKSPSQVEARSAETHSFGTTTFGLDPQLSDSDMDGYSDALELLSRVKARSAETPSFGTTTFGLDPLRSDHDGDALSDAFQMASRVKARSAEPYNSNVPAFVCLDSQEERSRGTSKYLQRRSHGQAKRMAESASQAGSLRPRSPLDTEDGKGGIGADAVNMGGSLRQLFSVRTRDANLSGPMRRQTASTQGQLTVNQPSTTGQQENERKLAVKFGD